MERKTRHWIKKWVDQEPERCSLLKKMKDLVSQLGHMSTGKLSLKEKCNKAYEQMIMIDDQSEFEEHLM